MRIICLHILAKIMDKIFTEKIKLDKLLIIRINCKLFRRIFTKSTILKIHLKNVTPIPKK